MDPEIARAAKLISRARRLVVLTGAGVSKESGIPTFREAQDGLWARYDPLEMASAEGFLRNPKLVWEWYEYRFGMVKQARPNAGHLAIAALEQLIPKVTVVTQNIDGLHAAAGSKTVLELHGSIQRYKCLSGRHTGFTVEDVLGQSGKAASCARSAATCCGPTWSGSASTCPKTSCAGPTMPACGATRCWWSAPPA